MTSTAKSYEHFSYQQLGQFIKSATEKHGPSILWDDSFELLSYDTNTVKLKYKFGYEETISGNFDFSSDSELLASPIFKIEDSVNDQGAWAWEGLMNVNTFLSGEWPNEQQFGNERDNLMETSTDSPVTAGAGNDFIVFDWGGRAAGNEGSDTFVLRNRGSDTESVILDYQQGENIVFPEFATPQGLVQSITALRFTENGFAVDFASPNGPWSVVFANLALDQLKEEDIFVGESAWSAMQPLVDAFGGRATLEDYLF